MWLEGVSVNGKPRVSKTRTGGSIPSTPAQFPSLIFGWGFSELVLVVLFGRILTFFEQNPEDFVD